MPRRKRKKQDLWILLMSPEDACCQVSIWAGSPRMAFPKRKHLEMVGVVYLTIWLPVTLRFIPRFYKRHIEFSRSLIFFFKRFYLFI